MVPQSLRRLALTQVIALAMNQTLTLACLAEVFHQHLKLPIRIVLQDFQRLALAVQVASHPSVQAVLVVPHQTSTYSHLAANVMRAVNLACLARVFYQHLKLSIRIVLQGLQRLALAHLVLYVSVASYACALATILSVGFL
jgi:hypothetical protein